MSSTKQANLEAREEVVNLISNTKSIIELHNGKKVKVGYIVGDTQDKIDTLLVEYEKYKKNMQPINTPSEDIKAEFDGETLNKANKVTRQLYAKMAAVILLNHPILNFFFWGIKWRLIYYFSGWNGEDYLHIISEAKKKAMEQEYALTMVLLMDMTTTWTMITKKEAEEYRQELELAREARSLRSSHP